MGGINLLVVDVWYRWFQNTNQDLKYKTASRGGLEFKELGEGNQISLLVRLDDALADQKLPI